MRLSGRGFACERHASRSNFKAERQRRRTICRLDRCRVSGWRLPPRRNDVIGGAECHVRRGLASEHALKERRSFDEAAGAGEARGFDYLVRIQHVIHVWSFLCSETIERSHVEPDPSPHEMSSRCPIARHRIRSARPDFTTGLACNAPSTKTEAIGARASSGGTAGAILPSASSWL